MIEFLIDTTDFKFIIDTAVQMLNTPIHIGNLSFTVMQADLGLFCLGVAVSFVLSLFDLR